MQLVDKFALSVASEDIWISGRPGEQRFCGGCHEDRAKNAGHRPGQHRGGPARPHQPGRPPGPARSRWTSATTRSGACPGTWPSSRSSTPSASAATTATRTSRATAATPSSTAPWAPCRPSPSTCASQPVPLMVGERQDYDYPASYVSLLGLEMELGENQVEIQVPGGGQMPSYVTPGQRPPVAADQEAEPAPALPGGGPRRARLRRGRPTRRTSAARS